MFETESESRIGKRGYSQLHFFADFGKCDQLKECLRAGHDVNLQDENGYTPLFLASSYGHLDCVITLLEYNADVRIADKWSETALLRACRKGFTEVVNALLEHQALNDAEPEIGRLAVMRAIEGGHSDLAMSLIKQGVGISTNRAGLLHLTATSGSLELSRYLLNLGCNPNEADENGWTPLHLACRFNKEEQALFLIRSGARIGALDKSGFTGLEIAKQCRNFGIINILKRETVYQARRQFMMFLSDYQFFEPLVRFPRESVVEKVLVTEDLNRYLMTLL